jgi:apolipoprotein D and lipocalin family protein
MKRISGFFLLLFLSCCTAIPENVTAVRGFDVNRYLGTWYEIARLDHRFEKGLEQVTAEYSLREDGGVCVKNRGFDVKANKWKEAVGKAYFLKDPGTGMLKVSFFGPFYGGYNIIALDQVNYSYSLVCGPDRSYLWILARQPVLDESIKTDLIDKAKALGFKTEKLIFVHQE